MIATAPAFLTIGMACFDDFYGVEKTVKGLTQNHKEILDQIEILVVDNNPTSGHGKEIKHFLGWVEQARYIPSPEVVGTAAPRNKVFSESKSPWTLCCDSHVGFDPGSLAKLIEWLKANPDCRDLLQGPLLGDNMKVMATHMKPVWRDSMFGIWNIDNRGLDPNAEPFEIPMHGLSAFCCRTDSWLGFSEKFREFGGEEGYIHEKYQKAGFKTLCLPFLRSDHRWGNPAPRTYPNRIPSRIANYLHGWDELNKSPTDIIDHFADRLSPQEFEPLRIGFPGVAGLQRILRGWEVSQTLPKVSCLMATHGRLDFVKQSLSCFLQQDYPNRELIILNNHPAPLEFDHPQVKIFNEPKYPTLGDCRNRLLELAEGEFIRTWDDDDLYLPWTLSQGVAHIGNAAAWKPRRSWFYEHGNGYRLEANTLEASMLVRANVARQYGYKASGGDEHRPLLEGLNEQGGVRQRDFGWFASYVYRWGMGVWNTSGTLGDGRSEEDRTAEWMFRNDDPGDGKLQEVNLAELWRQLALNCGFERDEFFNRCLPRHYPPESEFVAGQKCGIHDKIITRFLPNQKKLRALEFGRMRAGDDERRELDGWSTFYLARDSRIGELLSVDPDPKTVEACRAAIHQDHIGKVKFLWELGDCSPCAIGGMLDYVFFDAMECPLENLKLLRSVLSFIKPSGVIVVSDYEWGWKGLLIRAFLDATHRTYVIGDSLVFKKREMPECLQLIQ